MSEVFGRAREIAAIRRFLVAAQDRFSVLVLQGEPGIGKTALWHHAVGHVGVDVSGVGVLRCRTAEAETKLAFSSLGDLLAPVDEDALVSLPGPQRLALEVALLRASPEGVPLDPRAVAMGVLSLFDRLTDTTPVVVAIDDVQWLDRSSAAALSFALRRLDPARPLAVLATAREDPGSATEGLAFSLLPTRVERMRLGPLDLSALSRIIRAETRLVLPRPTLRRIEQESGGNPLFAVELARELHKRGAQSVGGERLPAPVGMTELLRARIEDLSTGARQALLIAALASDPTSSLVERALGPSSTDGLERARDAGIIEIADDRIRFAHPLYASTVVSSGLPASRRAVHRRLAGLVDDPEEQARHLAFATTEADEAVARMLDQGASLARSRAAWAAAALLLERAHELTPLDRLADRCRRGISAAEHHVLAGDRAHGRALIESILDEPMLPSLRADGLRLLAEITANDENLGEAVRLCHQALEYTDEPRLSATIELVLVFAHSAMMNWPTAGAHARRALAQADKVADGPLTAQALGHRAMLDFLCGRGVDWTSVERALELETPDAFVPLARRPNALTALLLLYVGRHDEARQRLSRLYQEAKERGDESDLAFLCIWFSWLETRSGDLAVAAGLADEAVSLAEITGSTSMHSWALTQQALVDAHLGDPTRTRRRCADAIIPVQASDNQLPHLWIVASLALLELSLGDAEAAWDTCAPLVEVIEQQGIAEPVPAFFLPDAIESMISVGQLDRADRLLTMFEERARALERVWALATSARCRGLHLGASGDLMGALAALEGSLVEHERIDLGFERARTLLTKGTVERRAGRRTMAKLSLGQAREEFERMGARLWAERATIELTRLSRRSGAADDGLTATERKVAELVVRGHTNREVAHRLFVSEKTVEAHLTRIYRKLGLRSRIQLVGRIGSDPTERGAHPPEM